MATNGTVNFQGQGGGSGIKDNVGILFTAAGGQSIFGGGVGFKAGGGAGPDASAFGNGGGGARDSGNTGGGFAGGDGSQGVVWALWVV